MKSTGITVNGKPLEDFLEQEDRMPDTYAILSKMDRPVLRNHTITKHTGNISGAKSSPKVRAYSVDQKAQKVRICDTVFLWKDKMQHYVPSGFSIEGAVELTEDESQIKCHECPEWFPCLTAHIAVHGLSPRAYKAKHKLRLQSSLSSTAVLEARRKIRATEAVAMLAAGKCSHEVRHRLTNRIHSNAEIARLRAKSIPVSGEQAERNNLLNKCREQTLAKLKKYADELGHAPTLMDLYRYTDENGKPVLIPQRLRRMFGVSRKYIYARAGLKLFSKSPGRPTVNVPHDAVHNMRDSGLSIRQIANQLHLGAGTIHRALTRSTGDRDPINNKSAQST